MAHKTVIKFAGPDSRDSFKAISVKGSLRVDPGKIYSRMVVERLAGDRSHYDVTTVKPHFEEADGDDKVEQIFAGIIRNST
jgi:hypothetical protein